MGLTWTGPEQWDFGILGLIWSGKREVEPMGLLKYLHFSELWEVERLGGRKIGWTPISQYELVPEIKKGN